MTRRHVIRAYVGVAILGWILVGLIALSIAPVLP